MHGHLDYIRDKTLVFPFDNGPQFKILFVRREGCRITFFYRHAEIDNAHLYPPRRVLRDVSRWSRKKSTMDRPKPADPCGDRRNAIHGLKALEEFSVGFAGKISFADWRNFVSTSLRSAGQAMLTACAEDFSRSKRGGKQR